MYYCNMNSCFSLLFHYCSPCCIVLRAVFTEIDFRVQFKLLIETFDILSGSRLGYLKDYFLYPFACLIRFNPPPPPQVSYLPKNAFYGTYETDTFNCCPMLWNILPTELQTNSFLQGFRQQLAIWSLRKACAKCIFLLILYDAIKVFMGLFLTEGVFLK